MLQTQPDSARLDAAGVPPRHRKAERNIVYTVGGLCIISLTTEKSPVWKELITWRMGFVKG